MNPLTKEFAIKTVIREFKQSKDEIALAFDKKDFLCGFAKSVDELINLVKNKRTKGIIFKSKCYLLKSRRILKSKTVLKETNSANYASEQLLRTAGDTKSNLERAITDSNTKVKYLSKFFSERADVVKLNKIHIEYDKDKTLPLFHSIDVEYNKLKLNATGQQMSLVTPFGVLRIHNTSKDVSVEGVSYLIGGLFGIPKKDVYKIIYSVA